MRQVTMRYGQRIEPSEKPGTVRVVGLCQVSKKEHAVEISARGLTLWQLGMLIQQALPSATPEEREFLQSGTSPEGWRVLFGPAYMEAIGANEDGTDKDVVSNG